VSAFAVKVVASNATGTSSIRFLNMASPPSLRRMASRVPRETPADSREPRLEGPPQRTPSVHPGDLR
jgi:hypothetical protein